MRKALIQLNELTAIYITLKRIFIFYVGIMQYIDKYLSTFCYKYNFFMHRTHKTKRDNEISIKDLMTHF